MLISKVPTNAFILSFVKHECVESGKWERRNKGTFKNVQPELIVM